MSYLYESIQDFPSDIGQTDVTLRAVNIIGEQRSPFGNAREIQLFPGAHWEIEIAILPAVRADAQRLESFLLSLRGKAGLFRCADPYRSLPLGSNLGEPRVSLSFAGDESFESRGWDPSEDGVLKAGDFIELLGNLHQVLQDVSSNADGEAQIRVWPPLRASYPDGTHIVAENARGVFSLDSNSLEFTRNVDGYNGAMIRAIEVPTEVPTDGEEITLGGETLTLGGVPITIVAP